MSSKCDILPTPKGCGLPTFTRPYLHRHPITVRVRFAGTCEVLDLRRYPHQRSRHATNTPLGRICLLGGDTCWKCSLPFGIFIAQDPLNRVTGLDVYGRESINTVRYHPTAKACGVSRAHDAKEEHWFALLREGTTEYGALHLFVLLCGKSTQIDELPVPLYPLLLDIEQTALYVLGEKTVIKFSKKDGMHTEPRNTATLPQNPLVYVYFDEEDENVKYCPMRITLRDVAKRIQWW